MLPLLLLCAAPPAVPTVWNLPGADGNVVTVAAGTVPAQKCGDRLVFVAPAGGPPAVTAATRNYVKAPPQFRLFAEPGKHIDFKYDDRPVVRFACATHDTSSPDAHELTFKPFYHVYDPATGRTLLTNGPGLAKDKSQLYPHHRGLFYAFNKISYGDQKDVDVWHGRKNEFVSFDKTLAEETGEVFAKHRAALTWHGRDGKPFAAEERALTAYAAPGGTLLDFASTLTTDRPSVKLDGDPQHAGFHFRAAMEVKDHGKQDTYYLRPDGKGKMGETRNWNPKDGKGPVDLPWNAISFVVKGNRYTVLRIDHPANPKPARGSEREYGRFGDYFAFHLTPTTPLSVKYRVWVQAGEMTVAECEAMATGFVEPPVATAKAGG
jgi:hypothetical protein